MKNNIIKTMTKEAKKVGFIFKKNSPEILIVAGTIGVVASAVMACKATTKVNDILKESKEEIEKVHKVLDDETITEEEYSIKDSQKDLAVIYAQTGIKLVKLYAPSVVLGALSLTGMISSNRILKKRNIALSAAYATLDKGFKEYRNRVVEKFGDEIDKQLRFNLKAEEIEEKTTDSKGKEIVTKKVVYKVDPNKISDYAKIFDEANPYWKKNSEYNLMFLKTQQSYANDLLKANGRLFLNEVYELIGFEKTKAGQVVGWVYDEECPVGDNFVDFGIYNLDNERAAAFVNGYERNILLDFNVDGDIWSMM